MSIRRFFTKRRLIWWGIAALVVGLIAMQVYKSKHDTSNILTETAKRQNLTQSVLATGEVVSNTDLSLSFKGSGIVKKVSVKVGDKVKADQLLANLEQASELASLTSARGALASAQANYNKVLSGASNEEIQVAQQAVDGALVTLNSTKAQQQIIVNNALRIYLNSGLEAEPRSGNYNNQDPVITGSYLGTVEGKYTIDQNGGEFNIRGLESIDDVNFPDGVTKPLGTKGLFITFPDGTTNTFSDNWDVEIPNTQASNYLTNLNAYQAALESQIVTVASAQSNYDSAVANLNLEKAQAQPADLQAAQAQVLSAQGQVQSAQSALENTIIRAPADGTITSVDIKVGELATSSDAVIVLQDVDNLYLEANVSEANVALIKMDQEVKVTFDALGPDREFIAKVASVEPASNVVSGVVNYKLTARIDQFSELRPGMTANMTIETGSRSNVIAVPQRAIIQKNNKKYIRVVTNLKTKAYVETEVQTGLLADGGLVEVNSGLQADQEIITFIDSK